MTEVAAIIGASVLATGILLSALAALSFYLTALKTTWLHTKHRQVWVIRPRSPRSSMTARCRGKLHHGHRFPLKEHRAEAHGVRGR